MSWNPFKSEEKTVVATQVSRVIDDKSLPDAIKSGSIKSVFAETGTVSDYLLQELVGSIGVRAEKMYRYAEAKYSYGLPSGEVYSSTQGRLQVEAAIEAAEGKQVSIEYSHYGTLNALHVGWMKLVASHGYNPETNVLGTLTTQKGKTVYLQDMVVVVPQAMLGENPGRIVQWGRAANNGYTPARPAAAGLVNLNTPTPINVLSLGSEVQLRVDYCWLESSTSTELSHASMTITLAGYDLTANYFHAKYIVDGHAKWWLYKRGTNTVTALEQVYVDGPAVSGSYFPFTYFRYGKASTVSDKTSNGYKTSKRMVKKLGMDYDTVALAIDANPNIGDVENAFMMFAVPPVSTDAAENEYLFLYWDNMWVDMDGTVSMGQVNADRTAAGYGSYNAWSSNYNTAVIQDARFKMTLGNSGIYKQLVAGSIGAVDSYSSEYRLVSSSYSVTDENGYLSEQVTYTPVHFYRHQVAEGIYEEIAVTDLKMTYYVYGGYATVGNETNTYLLVPLDYTVTKNMSLRMRETLYSRSLHLVFNSRTTYEVKWYQQDWFQAVMIVVAIVLTVIDMGSDGGSWIAGVLQLTGTQAIIATVIFNLIVQIYILPEAFKLFVKVFGTEVATIFAVVLIAWGAYELGTSGVKGAPFAQDMLMLSTGLQRAVMIENMSNLLDDAKEFETYVKKKDEELDTANKLLEHRTTLSPFVIFGEKPEEYFNRTVHYGNIGTLGINAISSYVDIALTLPKIQDTLGEELNDLSV